MIITKPVLKKMLKYAEKKIDLSISEEELHKKIKCLILENEIKPNNHFLDDAFTFFLNLCIISS